MGSKVNIPALLSDKIQIGNGGFTAGYDDQISISWQYLACLKHGNLNIFFCYQRVEIIKIGNMGKPQTDNMQTCCLSFVLLSCCPDFRGDIHAIFCWQLPLISKIGNNAKSRPACMGRNSLITCIKQAYIPSEFIDDKTTNLAVITSIKHSFCPGYLSDHAASVNIAYKHDLNPGMTGKSHIGNITFPQVNFCRTASALYQHQIILCLKPFKTIHHIWHQFRLNLSIIRCFGCGIAPALNNNL